MKQGSNGPEEAPVDPLEVATDEEGGHHQSAATGATAGTGGNSEEGSSSVPAAGNQAKRARLSTSRLPPSAPASVSDDSLTTGGESGQAAGAGAGAGPSRRPGTRTATGVRKPGVLLERPPSPEPEHTSGRRGRGRGGASAGRGGRGFAKPSTGRYNSSLQGQAMEESYYVHDDTGMSGAASGVPGTGHAMYYDGHGYAHAHVGYGYASQEEYHHAHAYGAQAYGPPHGPHGAIYPGPPPHAHAPEHAHGYGYPTGPHHVYGPPVLPPGLMVMEGDPSAAGDTDMERGAAQTRGGRGKAGRGRGGAPFSRGASVSLKESSYVTDTESPTGMAVPVGTQGSYGGSQLLPQAGERTGQGAGKKIGGRGGGVKVYSTSSTGLLAGHSSSSQGAPGRHGTAGLGLGLGLSISDMDMDKRVQGRGQGVDGRTERVPVSSSSSVEAGDGTVGGRSRAHGMRGGRGSRGGAGASAHEEGGVPGTKWGAAGEDATATVDDADELLAAVAAVRHGSGVSLMNVRPVVDMGILIPSDSYPETRPTEESWIDACKMMSVLDREAAGPPPQAFSAMHPAKPGKVSGRGAASSSAGLSAVLRSPVLKMHGYAHGAGSGGSESAPQLFSPQSMASLAGQYIRNQLKAKTNTGGSVSAPAAGVGSSAQHQESRPGLVSSSSGGASGASDGDAMDTVPAEPADRLAHLLASSALRTLAISLSQAVLVDPLAIKTASTSWATAISTPEQFAPVVQPSIRPWLIKPQPQPQPQQAGGTGATSSSAGSTPEKGPGGASSAPASSNATPDSKASTISEQEERAVLSTMLSWVLACTEAVDTYKNNGSLTATLARVMPPGWQDSSIPGYGTLGPRVPGAGLTPTRPGHYLLGTTHSPSRTVVPAPLTASYAEQVRLLAEANARSQYARLKGDASVAQRLAVLQHTYRGRYGHIERERLIAEAALETALGNGTISVTTHAQKVKAVRASAGVHLARLQSDLRWDLLNLIRTSPPVLNTQEGHTVKKVTIAGTGSGKAAGGAASAESKSPSTVAEEVLQNQVAAAAAVQESLQKQSHGQSGSGSLLPVSLVTSTGTVHVTVQEPPASDAQMTGLESSATCSALVSPAPHVQGTSTTGATGRAGAAGQGMRMDEGSLFTPPAAAPPGKRARTMARTDGQGGFTSPPPASAAAGGSASTEGIGAIGTTPALHAVATPATAATATHMALARLVMEGASGDNGTTASSSSGTNGMVYTDVTAPPAAHASRAEKLARLDARRASSSLARDSADKAGASSSSECAQGASAAHAQAESGISSGVRKSSADSAGMSVSTDPEHKPGEAQGQAGSKSGHRAGGRGPAASPAVLRLTTSVRITGKGASAAAGANGAGAGKEKGR